jgi:hypothetical protein
MLNHIVMFRRKAEVTADLALEKALTARMDGLVTQVPGILSWRLSANELDRPICWDWVLESSFDNVTGLNAYLLHPMHLALIADLKTYFEWAAVDYSI